MPKLKFNKEEETFPTMMNGKGLHALCDKHNLKFDIKMYDKGY